jgi:hypothetical protein
MKSLLLLLCAVAGATPCSVSVTTASGTNAPSVICSGELIFNEEFNTFDFQTWNHEKTATGGGVCIAYVVYYLFIYLLIYLFIYL